MKRRYWPVLVPALVFILAAGGCSQTSQAETTATAAAETSTAAETTAAAESETETEAEETPAAETEVPKDAAGLLTTVKTTQYFTDDPVPDADMEKILTAGINATSGMNQQPWHFSAVTDTSVLQEIADEMSASMPARPQTETAAEMEAAEKAPSKAQVADAPLAIIISCKDGSELDAGLACQNMFAEAVLLGYGAKIVSSPTIALNGENQVHYRELLGIPEDQTAVTVLLVGTEDTSVNPSADGYTGASTRNPMDDMVTWVTAK